MKGRADPPPKKEAPPAKAGLKDPDDLTKPYGRKSRHEKQPVFVGDEQSSDYPPSPALTWPALFWKAPQTVEDKR